MITPACDWPAWRSLLCRFAWFCLLAPAVAACAADFDYQVKIEAPDALRSLLEKNLDLLRWRGNALIDADQLRRLVQAAPAQAQTLVATEGYYSARITARLEPEGQAWRVVLEVKAGDPVRVGAVDIVVLGSGDDPQALARAAALRAGWSLTPGRLFRQADWEAAKQKLLRQAMLTRTPGAELTASSATVDPATHLAALKVVLDSGPAVFFGGLQIEGLRRYPASIVHRLNPIRPGDPYSEAALLELQSRLQDSGYFSLAEVSADPDASASAAPVRVRLTENKEKKVGAGIGYSTNTGNRAQLTYDDLNLSGLRLKSGVTLETRKQTARGDLFWPLDAQGASDSAGSSFERSDLEGVTTRLASVALKRAWGKPALERSLTLEYLNEAKAVAGLQQSRSQSLPLTYGVTWRRTDSLLFPTRGAMLHAQLGAALLPLLTDRRFLRGALRFVDFSHFQSFGKDDVLILRGEFGAVAAASRNGIPDALLFRAGGDQSVRGYAYQQLGVKAGEATVGGRYLATGGIELQHWLMPKWGAAAFYDAGNAADSLPALHPKSGYGIGVRWKSLVGPLNLDIAYGHAVKEYRMHFSLGFTF